MRIAKIFAFLLTWLCVFQFDCGGGQADVDSRDQLSYKKDDHEHRELSVGVRVENAHNKRNEKWSEARSKVQKNSLNGRALRGNRNRNRNERRQSTSRETNKEGKKESKHIDFLDSDVEPRPYINCIPVPPGLTAKSTKQGKKGMGKANRARNKKRKDDGASRDTASGRLLQRNVNNNSVEKRWGRGQGRNKHEQLPYCPVPTEVPTVLPTVTPFPTYTALRELTASQNLSLFLTKNYSDVD